MSKCVCYCCFTSDMKSACASHGLDMSCLLIVDSCSEVLDQMYDQLGDFDV